MMFRRQYEVPGSTPWSRDRRKSRPKRNLIRAAALEVLENRSLMAVSNLAFQALAPVEGQPFGAYPKLLATFTDANVNVSPTSFQATLQWGDGGIDTDIGRGGSVLILPDSSVESPSVPNQYDVFDTTAHTYLEEGTYLAQLSVTDLTDSGSGTAYSAVTVTDAPLFPVAVSPINATAGLSFTGTVGAFYDSDPNGTV